MTSHSRLKQRAREYAATNGVSYTEARRILTQDPAPAFTLPATVAPSTVAALVRPGVHTLVAIDGSGSQDPDRAIGWADAFHALGCEVVLFDTEVRPYVPGMTIEGSMASFQVVQEHIEGLAEHPEAVIVVTDGFIDLAEPLYPQRWTWLLVPDRTGEGVPENVQSWFTSVGMSVVTAEIEPPTSAATETTTETTTEDPVEQPIYTIQQEQWANGTLPYPFHIDTDGQVLRQDFWKGQVSRLVGFVDDPDSYDITVDADQFLTDPQAVLGKHPVFEDSEGEFVTYPGPVVTVTEHEVTQ